MKQHITLDDLNQLSKKGKKRLFLWSKTCKSFQDEIFEGDYDPNFPILSIGQMIEFLEHHGKLGQILHFSTWTGAICAWRVTNKEGIPSQIDGRPDFKELCDTLWESVKEVLED